jgi:hypothetical protein
MEPTYQTSRPDLFVNLLPPVIIEKLQAIDPSSDQRYLPWLKKLFVQKPFDLSPDFTVLLNTCLRYGMTLSNPQAFVLPSRPQLEKWMVKIQLAEHQKYVGKTTMKVIQPSSLKEIPQSIQQHYEHAGFEVRALIKSVKDKACYLIAVDTKRWVMYLADQHLIWNVEFEIQNPLLFLDQFEEELVLVNSEVLQNMKQHLWEMSKKYIHTLFHVHEIEGYMEDYTSGISISYLTYDEEIFKLYVDGLMPKSDTYLRLA